MSTRVEDDDLETRLLGDYSDAILRGETPDPRGIDPADASLIRELHTLGQAIESGPWLVPRSRATIARLTAAEGQPAHVPERSRDAAARRPSSEMGGGRGDGDEPVAPPLARLDRPSPAMIGPPAVGTTWWLPRFVAVAASLALLVVTATVIYLATTTWRDDEPPSGTALAAQRTLTAPQVAGGLPATPTATATPVATVTLAPIGQPTSTARSLPALASAPTPESFLVYEAFTEPSTVAMGVGVRDTFARTSVDVPWDGTGQIVLSGCPDRPCDLVVDDRLYIQVTNAERAERGLWIDDNGISTTLPVVLTERFRPGTNQVNAALLDEQGDQRGVQTPVYIVILR
ncbi:MAG: hypothetical protein ACRDJH_25030 [Thermomicrobiales bacterium]